MSSKDDSKQFNFDMSFDETLGRFIQTDPGEVRAVQNEHLPEATIVGLIDAFEASSQKTDDGIEFWYARDLQQLLEYGEWRNFQAELKKAMTACTESGNVSEDHFVEVNKMIDIGKGAQRKVTDFMLSRYACYLTAQNGDAQKRPWPSLRPNLPYKRASKKLQSGSRPLRSPCPRARSAFTSATS